MVILVIFSLRRNLQLEEGQVRNLLTEETPAGWGWLHLTLVTFSLRRNLQGVDGYRCNLLTEEITAGGGGLEW
jgi:hypothetical protein